MAHPPSALEWSMLLETARKLVVLIVQTAVHDAL